MQRLVPVFHLLAQRPPAAGRHPRAGQLRGRGDHAGDHHAGRLREPPEEMQQPRPEHAHGNPPQADSLFARELGLPPPPGHQEQKRKETHVHGQRSERTLHPALRPLVQCSISWVTSPQLASIGSCQPGDFEQQRVAHEPAHDSHQCAECQQARGASAPGLPACLRRTCRNEDRPAAQRADRHQPQVHRPALGRRLRTQQHRADARRHARISPRPASSSPSTRRPCRAAAWRPARVAPHRASSDAGAARLWLPSG